MLRSSILIGLLVVLPSVILATDSTYYFVKWDPNSDGIILEMIETLSDSSQTTPTGFSVSTETEINAAGYMTPSESYASANSEDIDEGVSDGYSWGTWFTCETVSGIKRVYGGSRTGRTWLPGYLYLLARNACVSIPNPWPRILFKSDSTYYRTWGWNTQWVYLRQYSSVLTYTWQQKGWHKWSSDGDPQYTIVQRRY